MNNTGTWLNYFILQMIIMIGFPASGKSSFVKNTILPKGHVHINRDTLKTPQKCLSTTDNALQNGDSVSFCVFASVDLLLHVCTWNYGLSCLGRCGQH